MYFALQARTLLLDITDNFISMTMTDFTCDSLPKVIAFDLAMTAISILYRDAPIVSVSAP